MKDDTFSDYIFDLSVYGFCVIEKLLEEDIVTEFRTILDSLIDNQEDKEIVYSPDGAGKIKNQSKLINLFTQNQLFFQLIDHPRVLPIVEHFLGRELILASLNGRVLTKDMPEQHLHTDIPYQLWNRDKEIMINVMWLIDEYKENNGATVFLPMSHRSQLPAPPTNKAIRYLKKIIAPAGTAIIFNGSCWHGSTKNETDEPRRAIFSQYRVGHWMNFQFDPNEGFPEDWIPEFSLRQRELLRMNYEVKKPKHNYHRQNNFKS